MVHSSSGLETLPVAFTTPEISIARAVHSRGRGTEPPLPVVPRVPLCRLFPSLAVPWHENDSQVKMAPKAVSQREESELQAMLERLALENEEIDGDAPEDV